MLMEGELHTVSGAVLSKANNNTPKLNVKSFSVIYVQRLLCRKPTSTFANEFYWKVLPRTAKLARPVFLRDSGVPAESPPSLTTAVLSES